MSATPSSTWPGAFAREVLDLVWGSTLGRSRSCATSCARSEGVSSTCEGAVDALVMLCALALLCALLCREGEEGSASTASSGSRPGTGLRVGAGARVGAGPGAGEWTTDVFRCGIWPLVDWAGGAADRVGSGSGVGGGNATGSVSALLGAGGRGCARFIVTLTIGWDCVRGGPGRGETGERSCALGTTLLVGIAP